MSTTTVASEVKAVPPVVSSIQDIPVAKIRESKTNPRTQFDQSKLAELVEGRHFGTLYLLLIAQRNHGIDMRGVPRRHVAGGERDEREQNRNDRERQWIIRTYGIEQAAHQPRKGKRGSDANKNAGRYDLEAVAKDQLQHVWKRGEWRERNEQTCEDRDEQSEKQG